MKTVLINHVPSFRALSDSELGTSYVESLCPSNLSHQVHEYIIIAIYYKQNCYNLFRPLELFSYYFSQFSLKIHKITKQSCYNSKQSDFVFMHCLIWHNKAALIIIIGGWGYEGTSTSFGKSAKYKDKITRYESWHVFGMSLFQLIRWHPCKAW